VASLTTRHLRTTWFQLAPRSLLRHNGGWLYSCGVSLANKVLTSHEYCRSLLCFKSSRKWENLSSECFRRLRLNGLMIGIKRWSGVLNNTPPRTTWFRLEPRSLLRHIMVGAVFVWCESGKVLTSHEYSRSLLRFTSSRKWENLSTRLIYG